MSKKTKTKIENGVHYFNADEAIKYGIEKATMIYNIRYWLKINRANDTNIKTKDGKKYYWSFNTVSAYKDIFPYFTESSMQRWLKELEKDGVVIVGSFNKKKYDRTKWYTLPEFEIDETITQNDECNNQNDEPIPDSKQQIINTHIPIEEEVKVEKGVTLPKNRGTHPADRLLYLYGKLYKQVYDTTYKADFGRDKKIFNQILTQYSEIQVAYMLCVYFNWHGMTGNSSNDYNFVTGATFPIPMFKTMINKFEVYARNIMSAPFDDDEKLLDEVLKIVAQ